MLAVFASLVMSASSAPAMRRDGAELANAELRERLTRATTAWAARDYPRALGILERAREEHPSPAIARSVGACHYALEDYARALVAFEASDGSEHDRAMIRACRARLALPERDEIDAGTSGGARWAWGALAVLAQLLGLRLLARARPRRALSTILIACGLLAALLLARDVAGHGDGSFARVVTADAKLFAEPHESSAALGTLAPGTKIRILASSRDWTYIEHPRIRAWLLRRCQSH